MTDPLETIQKVDGRTRAARAQRAGVAASRSMPIDPDVQAMPDRPSVRGNVREQVREPTRETLRDGEVVGRNGEVLSRRRSSVGDIFQIPPTIIPKEWEYQWCAISVVGNTEVLLDQNLMFAENGWRPVPSERHDGRYMPVGHRGNIVRGGQMLMERPKALCDEARREDQRAAVQQIKDRDQSLMGGKANTRNARCRRGGAGHKTNRLRPLNPIPQRPF